MNYPLIYSAVYCEPLVIEPSAFYSIHSILFPRITQGRDLDGAFAANGSTDRPVKSPYNGRRATKAAPTIEWQMGRAVVVDDRFYYTLAGRDDVAVVPVYGVLAKNASWIEESCFGVSDINAIGHAIQQASDNKNIKTLVLDVASPGGQVTGIREIATMVRNFSQSRGRTVYAFTDERMCSAAYWIGSQANEIYNTPTANIGSIGTYMAWLDDTIKLQLEGRKLEYFGAGKYKGMGLPGKPLTQDDRVLLQSRVNEINTWFTSGVKEARPKIEAPTMEGQTFLGTVAPSMHLTDGLVNSWDEFIAVI